MYIQNINCKYSANNVKLKALAHSIFLLGWCFLFNCFLFWCQQQIVIKTLETHYRRVEGISGATILGDGKVALILDTDSIASMNLGSSSFDVSMLSEDLKTTGTGG